MRLNNLSSRLIVNEWLSRTSRDTISADLDYLEFANRIRAIVAPGQIPAQFVDRSDAVAYIRFVAADIQAGGPISKR